MPQPASKNASQKGGGGSEDRANWPRQTARKTPVDILAQNPRALTYIARSGLAIVDTPDSEEEDEEDWEDDDGLDGSRVERLQPIYGGNVREKREKVLTETARSRLPPLTYPRGAPLRVTGIIGGATVIDSGTDIRLTAMSTGFPISVHPLRLPNTRAQFSTGSSESIVDFRFVRIAGLLHKLIPLRDGVDKVVLTTIFSNDPLEVYGHVTFVFDAQDTNSNIGSG